MLVCTSGQNDFVLFFVVNKTKVGFHPFGLQVASEVWIVFNHVQTIFIE